MKKSILALPGANLRCGSPSSTHYGAVAMTLHWVIALLVVLDFALAMSFRYFNPGARWAVWASRAAKGGSVLLVVK